MKGKLKKFFLLGLGVATVGIAYANRDKIKRAVEEVVRKGKITVEEGKKLTEELVAEVKRAENRMATKTKKAVATTKKKVAAKKTASKKPAVKKPVAKKPVAKKTVAKKK